MSRTAVIADLAGAAFVAAAAGAARSVDRSTWMVSSRRGRVLPASAGAALATVAFLATAARAGRLLWAELLALTIARGGWGSPDVPRSNV